MVAGFQTENQSRSHGLTVAQLHWGLTGVGASGRPEGRPIHQWIWDCLKKLFNSHWHWQALLQFAVWSFELLANGSVSDSCLGVLARLLTALLAASAPRYGPCPRCGRGRVYLLPCALWCECCAIYSVSEEVWSLWCVRRWVCLWEVVVYSLIIGS